MFKFLIAIVIVLAFLNPSIAAAFEPSAVFSAIHVVEAHPYIAMATMAAAVMPALRSPRRYFRKRQVADRYGYVSVRAVDRAWLEGRFPPPTIYQSRHPLWAEDVLDAWDAERGQNIMQDRAAHSPTPPPAPPRGRKRRRGKTAPQPTTVA